MTRHPLEGVTVPLVTPMTTDGIPDESALSLLLDYVLQADVDTLFLFGGNGEHVSILREEIETWLRAARRHLEHSGKAGRVSLVCGTGGASTREAVLRGEAALRGGAEALVVMPPFYFRYGDDELVAHYRSLAALKAPIIAYNIPLYTQNPLTLGVVEELLDLPELIGVKDSSGDDAYFLDLLRLASRRPGFGVSQGSERRLLWGLEAGAIGIVPGLANVAPSMCVELYRARGSAGAQKIQEQLTQLTAIHRIRSGIAGTKCALKLLGVGNGVAGEPFRSLDAKQTELVAEILASVGLEKHQFGRRA